MTFLFLLLLAIYSKPIFFHPTLNFDDTSLIEPLKQVHSFGKYRDLIEKNIILDVQPVRDFTFWLELEFESLTGFRNSQLINLLIWFGSLLFLNAILKRWNVSDWSRFVIITLVAIHPVVTSSVSWTSARKHVLSVFFLSWLVHFMLFSTGFWSRCKQYLIYFLVCFSQPINILAPFFVGLGDWSISRKLKPFKSYFYIFGFAVVGAFSAYVNLNYYTGDYVKQTGEILPKFLAEENQKMIFRIFVWGRSFFQLINPVAASPVPYRILKNETFIGLTLLILFVGTIWIFRKRFHRDRLLLSLMMMASPVLVMTIKLTHHLGWDTYLLSSVWSLGLLGGAYKWPNFPSRIYLLIFSAILLTCAAVSFTFASKWANDHDLNEYAYLKEGIFFAQENYARQLLHEKENWTLAKELVDDLEKKSPQRITLPYLKARVVYQAPVGSQEKHKMFLDIETAHPWIQYYFAAFEASQGQPNKGYLRLKHLWFHSQGQTKNVTKELFPVYVSNWYKMCQKANLEDCEWIHTETKAFSEQKSKE